MRERRGFHAANLMNGVQTEVRAPSLQFHFLLQ
jgi:hypothetical protein